MVRIVTVYEEDFPFPDLLYAIVYHTAHTPAIDHQNLQTLVYVQTRKTVICRRHVWKVLEVDIIGRVCALFIPIVFSQSFIPAAKSPLLKNFILIADVKISGILDRIYIAYIAPFAVTLKPESPE